MMGNINDLLSMYKELRQDPVKFLTRKYNIPSNMSDPNAIVQHLLNTGQVSQDQVNQIMNMRNDPTIRKIFGS